MAFYISASGLGAFYRCPALYYYRKHWECQRKPPARIVDGLAVHQALAGDSPPRPGVLSPEQERLYKKLLRLISKQEYKKVVAKEIRQEVMLSPGVVLVRVIDAIWLNSEGKPVIVDYKTGLRKWVALPAGRSSSIPGEARGFQAAAYLVKPRDPAPLKQWPDEIHFLVAASEGTEGQVHVYKRNDQDEENLRHATYLVREANLNGWFPQVRGHQCSYCDFQEMCWEVPGWQRNYVQKEDQHEEAID